MLTDEGHEPTELVTLEKTLSQFVPQLRVRFDKLGGLEVELTVHGLKRVVTKSFPRAIMINPDTALRTIMPELPEMIINSYGDNINNLEGKIG